MQWQWPDTRGFVHGGCQAHTVHNHGETFQKAQLQINLKIFKRYQTCAEFIQCLQSTRRVRLVRWLLRSDALPKGKKKCTHSPSEAPGRLSQNGLAVRTADWAVSCGASVFPAISLSQDLATVATNPTSHCEFLFSLQLWQVFGWEERELGFHLSRNPHSPLLLFEWRSHILLTFESLFQIPDFNFLLISMKIVWKNREKEYFALCLWPLSEPLVFFKSSCYSWCFFGPSICLGGHINKLGCLAPSQNR